MHLPLGYSVRIRDESFAVELVLKAVFHLVLFTASVSENSEKAAFNRLIS
jgi:hypothetical protein